MDSLTLNVVISFKITITDFLYKGFLSQTLTIHRTAGEGRGPSFIPTRLSQRLCLSDQTATR